MLVVIASVMLTPGRSFDPGLDLEQHFFDNARPFFIVGAMMIVSLTIADLKLLGIPVFSAENLIRYLATILCLVMAYVENRRFHYVAALGFGVLLVAFIMLAKVI
jgi:hypothetical protein